MPSERNSTDHITTLIPHTRTHARTHIQGYTSTHTHTHTLTHQHTWIHKHTHTYKETLLPYLVYLSEHVCVCLSQFGLSGHLATPLIPIGIETYEHFVCVCESVCVSISVRMCVCVSEWVDASRWN